MPDASAIRMGGAYVEISADDSPMLRRLRESQARLKAWAAENSGGMQISRGTEAAALAEQDAKSPTFFRGSFKGTELVEGGLKFAAAIAATKAAIADVRIYSALFRGDMEGARKAAEALPFGLGEIVKELSGPVDSAANALIARLTGTWQMKDVYAGKSSKADLKATVDQFNRGESAIKDVDKALAKATMSARDLAKHEVAGLKLSADAAGELLAKKLQLIDVDEKKKAYEKQVQAGRAIREAFAGESRQLEADYQKLVLSAADFARYQAKAKGYTDEEADSIRRGTQALEDRKAAIENAAIAAQNAIDADVAKMQEGIDLLTEMEHESAKAAQEIDSLREAVMTPEERARALVEKYQGMDLHPETRRRAIQKALEDAAAAVPDVARATIGVRGTFNAADIGSLGAGSTADRLATAADKTAANTEKIAALMEKFGLNFG